MATTEDYKRALQGLLPSGQIWPRDHEAWLSKLLESWAAGFARLDKRIDQLSDELDPRTTFELLENFEYICGLPGECAGLMSTLEERRQAVHAKLTGKGAQTPAYYIKIAKTLGYDVTIHEYTPFCAGWSCAGDPANSEQWSHVWQINAPETTIKYFRANSGQADTRLAIWGNALLECTIKALIPAHTIVLFAYGN